MYIIYIISPLACTPLYFTGVSSTTILCSFQIAVLSHYNKVAATFSTCLYNCFPLIFPSELIEFLKYLNSLIWFVCFSLISSTVLSLTSNFLQEVMFYKHKF